MTVYSGLMTTFLGEGTLAAIPLAATIAPTIPPGMVAFYFATDTANLYAIINGASAWTNVTGTGGGGGGGGALTEIATLTATGGETVLSFTSIVNTYRDLQIVASVNLSGVDQILMTFNADTSGDYDYFDPGGISQNQSNIPIMYGFPAGTSTSYFTSSVLDIIRYSKTDRWKIASGHQTQQNGSSTTSMASAVFGGKWRNVAAISRIDLSVGSGGSFTAGSEFTLYGRS